MRYYEMTIDGTEYNALFHNDEEFVRFKWDCEADECEVELKADREVNVDDILGLPLEWAYKIEMIADMVLPNAREYHKWYEQEQALKELGVIA